MQRLTAPADAADIADIAYLLEQGRGYAVELFGLLRVVDLKDGHFEVITEEEETTFSRPLEAARHFVALRRAKRLGLDLEMNGESASSDLATRPGAQPLRERGESANANEAERIAELLATAIGYAVELGSFYVRSFEDGRFGVGRDDSRDEVEFADVEAAVKHFAAEVEAWRREHANPGH